MVLKDKGGEQLKIIDFGTAQDLSINPKPKVMVGTPEFIGTLKLQGTFNLWHFS